MAQHVEDDAAVVFLAVVPRRPLRRLPVAFEHPVPELAAHRQDAAEESGVDQHLHLEQAGQPQLVLHHAVLDALGAGVAVHVERRRRGGRDRLFHVHVLAGGDGLVDHRRAQAGRRGVEKDRVVLVRQCRAQIGGPALDAMGTGQRRELGLVASDQDRVRHHPIAIGQRDAALRANREDRTDQVLIGAHPARYAVHDDAESMLRHGRGPMSGVTRRRRDARLSCTRQAHIAALVETSPIRGVRPRERS